MEASEQFNQALRAYQHGQYAAALDGFQKLAAIMPQASEVQLNMGNVYFQMARFQEAENHWQKAVDLDPLEANAYLNLGNLYFKQERLQQAIGQWEIFKKLQKNHPHVWLNLGLAYDQSGQLEKAMECYGVFLGLQPTTSEAQRLKTRFDGARKVFENNVPIADDCLRKGDKQQAYEIFKRTLAAYPGNAKVYKTYASLLYQQEQYQEALTVYLKAYAQKPDDSTVLTNLGVLYEKLGQPAWALWAYFQARSLSSPDQARVSQRFEALLASHKSSLSQALETVKQDYKRGLLMEAETGIDRLLKLTPYLDTQLKGEVGTWHETIQERLDPNLKATKFYYNQGVEAQEQGRFEQAMQAYQKLLALRPTGAVADEVRERLVKIKDLMSAVVNTLLEQKQK